MRVSIGEIPDRIDRGEAARRPGRRDVASFLMGAAAGVALLYGFEPRRGRRRRATLRDRLLGQARRGSRRMVRSARNRATRAEGHGRGLMHRLSKEPVAQLDDVELAHKVESVLFRDPSMPKGQININAEGGRVFLRGEVDEPELVSELERAVRQVPGVRDVENLLHVPGTPAPHARGKALLEERPSAA